MPMIEFARPDGSRCSGYFAGAGSALAGNPGVIVLQEWWGLNPHICSIVDRFAAAGYHALAPDLYHGRVAQSPDEARHLMDGLDFPGATFQDIRGAIADLRARSGAGRIGVMGYCMGGALTVASAVHLPEVAAAVCYYGLPPADFADPAAITVPFMGHFASEDSWITPAWVDQVEAAMKAAGRQLEIHRYQAAHAFSNRTRPEVYDAAAAELAWQRTLEFLGKHLGRVGAD